MEDYPCHILSGVFGNMPYEWDEAKRRETLETRGIDFAEIYGFDWGASMNWVSNRHGEERQVNLGMIGESPVSCGMGLARRKQANHQPAKSQRTGGKSVTMAINKINKDEIIRCTI